MGFCSGLSAPSLLCMCQWLLVAEMGRLHGESLQAEVPGSCLGRRTRVSGREACTDLLQESGPHLRAATLCDLPTPTTFTRQDPRVRPSAQTPLLRFGSKTKQLLPAFLHPCHCYLCPGWRLLDPPPPRTVAAVSFLHERDHVTLP